MLDARRRKLLLVGLVAAVALGSSAGPAAASHVKCGSVLKKDTTLHADVTGCTGNGLVIGRSGITVDLNGHTVQGSRTGTGIDDSAGYDRVAVMNGTVSRFSTGVLLRGARRVELEDLAVSDVRDGVVLESSRRNVVNRVRVDDASGGILLSGSTRNLVTHSRSRTQFTALSLFNSDRNRVDENVLVGDSALSVSQSDRNEIEGNSVPGGGHGFRLSGNRNVVEENTITRLPFSGIELTAGSGNALRWNETSANGFSGIIVSAGASNTELRANVASRNQRDGLTVLSPSTTLRRNSATFNTELGINAPNGARDAGGNRAFGNGDERQCVGVACAG